VLEDHGSGTWGLNQQARELAVTWLRERGIQDATAFIASDKPLHELLGVDWAKPKGTRVRKSRLIANDKPATQGQALRPAETTLPVSTRVTDLSSLVLEEVSRIRTALIGFLRELDDREFENLIARILDALGFRDTVVVGRPGDGGVDVRCVMKNRLLEATVAVQVKRQLSNVGPKEISYLRDRWARRVDKLLFITTSDYTSGAREVAEDEGATRVTLVNGNELADLLIEERIGVSTRVVESLQLDEEFLTGS
jgi:restriction system protein